MTICPVDSPALPVGNYRLSSWGLIQVSGADAVAFLHAQLSNDLSGLPVGRAQWTAYCSPKGRMLAGFLAWKQRPDLVCLACDRELVAALVKRMRMFVLRAKVVVTDVSSDWALAGAIGRAGQPAPMEVVEDGGSTLVGLTAVAGQTRCLVVAAAGSGAGDDWVWQLAQIRAGEVWITPATSEQFVPQMANFDAIGGINFKKGCYPGQEVVARTHYRGAVKRRMYRARVGAPAVAGVPLFAAQAQECGTVANAVTDDTGRSELLAVISSDSRDSAPVRLGAPEGPPLEFIDLPYMSSPSA
ncbi:MAG: folate-binding protein YgfZ [Burkholderiales bacterium]|nr:folate-binding protein YgfZ [Burkholderiales bacterium]